MKKWNVYRGVVSGALVVLFSGCSTVDCGRPCVPRTTRVSPSAPIRLPAGFKNPDSITLGPNNEIYLTINNSSDPTLKPKIAILDQDDRLRVFCALPTHPLSGKTSPLGIAFGADGNLYVADNQTFISSEPGRSRLLRVNIEDGRAVGVDVVVTGLTAANGVSCYEQYVVVNDTCIEGAYPQKSGTYRFTLDQLQGDPVEVTGWNDPHLLVKLTTQNKTYQVGANGVVYDHDGNLYVCNFGDREISKTTFASDGTIETTEVFVRGQGLESVDGLQMGSDGKIWVADFNGNAVASVCPLCGTVDLIAKNEPGTGADGGLDAPAECVRRGDKVYASNIDLTFGPNTADDLHTISVYDLH